MAEKKGKNLSLVPRRALSYFYLKAVKMEMRPAYRKVETRLPLMGFYSVHPRVLYWVDSLDYLRTMVSNSVHSLDEWRALESNSVD